MLPAIFHHNEKKEKRKRNLFIFLNIDENGTEELMIADNSP